METPAASPGSNISHPDANGCMPRRRGTNAKKDADCVRAVDYGRSACSADKKRFRPGFDLFSKEQDIQLGKESAAEVEKKMKVLDNSEPQTYIATVGKNLTSSADAVEFPYSFKVVVDKSINAFALPGGPMYIHTGLIAAADNESQMAGVMDGRGILRRRASRNGFIEL